VLLAATVVSMILYFNPLTIERAQCIQKNMLGTHECRKQMEEESRFLFQERHEQACKEFHLQVLEDIQMLA
jgi:hypothetical protein